VFAGGGRVRRRTIPEGSLLFGFHAAPIFRSMRMVCPMTPIPRAGRPRPLAISIRFSQIGALCGPRLKTAGHQRTILRRRNSGRKEFEWSSAWSPWRKNHIAWAALFFVDIEVIATMKSGRQGFVGESLTVMV